MKKQNQKGFTLVEIMIVVVIIGLLAAMAIPAFQKVRETSQEKTITNNLRQLASGAEQYFLEEGVNSVSSSDLVGTWIKEFDEVADGGDSYTETISTSLDELTAEHPNGSGDTISIEF